MSGALGAVKGVASHTLSAPLPRIARARATSAELRTKNRVYCHPFRFFDPCYDPDSRIIAPFDVGRGIIIEGAEVAGHAEHG